jgi:hypothetical protein
MFKPAWMVVVVLAALAPGASLAKETGRAQAAAAVHVRVPPSARMVATAEIDRVHAFPEQKKRASLEAIVGVHAVDRVYEVGRSYADVVGFFDRQATDPGILLLGRDATRTATTWALMLSPDGRVANVIVRNTAPTTVEIVSATGVAETLQPALRAP